MPDIHGAFGLIFTEQVEFFRQKLNLPTAFWDDLWQEEHDRAFVVAGALKADLLADLNAAVDRAIHDGTGLDVFRKDFWKIVAERGWHGWTGEGSASGEAWRTRVIWETNLLTSYAAGRHAQPTDPELLALCPYWKYVHSDSVQHPRPQHLAWNGMVLHHDHEFWQTHFPPNGWGCQCRVTAVTAPGEDDPTEPPPDWDVLNEKTGQMPGIDKGWAYAPGASVSGELRRVIEEKAAKLPKELAAPFVREMAAGLPPRTPADFIAAGRRLTESLPTDPETLYPALTRRLAEEVGTGREALLANTGRGVILTRAVSRLFPAAWVQATDAFGPLRVKLRKNGRGWHASITNPAQHPVGSRANLPDFGIVVVEKNAGYTVVNDDIGNAIHEFAHRLQNALPGLQALFKELHVKRTAGDPLEKLMLLKPMNNYKNNELTRQDHYISPYWGKDYDGEPLEVMPMAFQTVLSGTKWERGHNFKKLYNEDREMFDFVVGLLFRWMP